MASSNETHSKDHLAELKAKCAKFGEEACELLSAMASEIRATQDSETTQKITDLQKELDEANASLKAARQLHQLFEKKYHAADNELKKMSATKQTTQENHNGDQAVEIRRLEEKNASLKTKLGQREANIAASSTLPPSHQRSTAVNDTFEQWLLRDGMPAETPTPQSAMNGGTGVLLSEHNLRMYTQHAEQSQPTRIYHRQPNDLIDLESVSPVTDQKDEALQPSTTPAIYQVLLDHGALASLTLPNSLPQDESNGPLQEYLKDGCRMVLMTNVPTDTPARDVFARIRGGAVMKLVFTPPLGTPGRTAVITFASSDGAKRYVEWCKLNKITFKGSSDAIHQVDVKLASGEFDHQQAYTFPHSREIAIALTKGQSRCVVVRDCTPFMARQIFREIGADRPHLRHNLEDVWYDEVATMIIHFTDFQKANSVYTTLTRHRAYIDIHQTVSFKEDPCAGDPQDLFDGPKPSSEGLDSLMDIADIGVFELDSYLSRQYDNDRDLNSPVPTTPSYGSWY
ncbi:hypothetical protein UCRPA7_4532 [Phaeoacremonium minimum UCRPA7]|uniref:Uncharacterized protein n=1 Tax=Phaeoacremonium minimum (strain UCR-PA7) TaxID=1286976 RepID=R8BKR2_PHAM7|nr:hypothetical protein UCRPA7_4532 [Phaeoacremonium minimum UCRPA7]EON99953.1 hypothetical protein UCRPA7_4532 [Phaeoacremonium minimum UCRPA7]